MSRPDVLLVTIDSLRADHVHGDAAATPTFDRLREGGTNFGAAFAQGPYTTFSVPSLFASRYPSGLEYVEISEATAGVAVGDATTVAEAFREAGYATAGFHSNPLLSYLFGFGDGFETFDARLPFANTDLLPGRAKVLADKLRRLVRLNPYLPAEKLNARALDWLDAREDDRPCFLWLHYMDPHGPYQPASGNPWLGKFGAERRWRRAVHEPGTVDDSTGEQLRRAYAAEVERTDRALGTLLDGLADRGLRDDAVVAVTADHGEGFGEHGTFSHPHELYDELIHVPLVVDWPGRDGGRVEQPVELLGVAPTLCRAAGIDVPDSMEGEPLPTAMDRPEESGADEHGEARAIAEADVVPHYHGCVRTERRKYVRDSDEERLYDLANDPDETEPVTEPDLREHLAGVLDEHLTRSAIRNANDGERVDIEDGAVQDRLADLGYME